MMKDIIITKDIKADDWDNILENSKDTNISISRQYYDAVSYGHEFIRLLAYEDRKPIALLQGKIYLLKKIRLKKLVIGSMSGNGIAIIDSKKKLQNTVYEKFVSHFRKENIDIMEIWSFDKQHLPGYHEDIAYTITLNLEKPLENLWQNLGEKTRTSIKKAQKNSVTIQIDKSPKLEKYYDLYRETSIRGSFDALEYKHLDYSTDMLSKEGVLKVFTAHIDENIASFAYILHYKNIAYYWMGGSNEKSHKVAGSDLLHWKIIEWAKTNGCKEYNMWGADPNPCSKSYRVYKFKIGFGGDLVKINTYQKRITFFAKILYNAKYWLNKYKKKHQQRTDKEES